MANKVLTVIDIGRSDDTANLLAHPRFLMVADFPNAFDWAMMGAHNKVLPVVADIGDAPDVVGFVRRRAFFPAEGFVSGPNDALRLGGSVQLLPMTLSDFGDSVDTFAFGIEHGLLIEDIGDAPDTLDFALLLPAVLPGGTINVIRNPSLENDEAGLTDWSADAGIDLVRDNTDAWAGNWSAFGTVAAGAGVPAIVVLSQPGLFQQSLATYWTGSISGMGTAAQVNVTLRAYYTTGLPDETLPADGDTEDIIVPTADWIRWTTDTLLADPTRVLDHLALVIAVPQEAGDVTIRLDGAQIEPSATGGVSPYTDGDQGVGNEWLGAPGFSMSIRGRA